MARTYSDHLKEISDRLGGIDARLTSIEDRVTTGATSDRADALATRGDMMALKQTMNDEQAQQNIRLGGVEKYVALRSSIERGAIWVTGITVSVAGVVLGLLKALD